MPLIAVCFTPNALETGFMLDLPGSRHPDGKCLSEDGAPAHPYQTFPLDEAES